MKTQVIQQVLPPTIPQGWKKKVAVAMGVHPQTVSRALGAGKGPMYMKVIETAVKMYGKVVAREVER